MKRSDAIAKAATICANLDATVGTHFWVTPLSLYLFGSTLTEKPLPHDVDLVFRYRYPYLTEDEIAEQVMDMTYGKSLRDQKACIALARGLKHLRWQMAGDSTIEVHMKTMYWDEGTPVRLIWEPGYDWRTVLMDISEHPLPWDPAVEIERKYIKAVRILAEAPQLVAPRGTLTFSPKLAALIAALQKHDGFKLVLPTTLKAEIVRLVSHMPEFQVLAGPPAPKTPPTKWHGELAKQNKPPSVPPPTVLESLFDKIELAKAGGKTPSLTTAERAELLRLVNADPQMRTTWEKLQRKETSQ